VSGNRFYGFPLVYIADKLRFYQELELLLVDLERSKVVTFNDKIMTYKKCRKMYYE